MEFDLNNITFCFHVRLDTKERIRNIKIVTDYYRKYCTNFQFIFFEDTNVPDLLNHITLTENDKYIFIPNNGEWIKARGFNLGAKISDNNIIVFHDTDIILHQEQLIKGRDYLNINPQTGLLYPHDGLFLFVKQSLKDEFAKTLNYNTLYQHLPKIKHVLYENDVLQVAGTSAVGGCVMVRRDVFFKFKGYNPFFRGWGYEDDEISHRVHRLGYDVVRLRDMPMWHLPHIGEGSSKRETNTHHIENRNICSWVEKQDKPTLEKYIKTWDIL